VAGRQIETAALVMSLRDFIREVLKSPSRGCAGRC